MSLAQAVGTPGRRLVAVFKAAFITAVPFLTFPLMFGWFGLIIWLCLFVPALLGNVLLLLPAKLYIERRDLGWWSGYCVVLSANVALTVGLATLVGVPLLSWIIVGLAAAAVIAASIWYALDDKAVSGPTARYSKRTYDA